MKKKTRYHLTLSYTRVAFEFTRSDELIVKCDSNSLITTNISVYDSMAVHEIADRTTMNHLEIFTSMKIATPDHNYFLFFGWNTCLKDKSYNLKPEKYI